VPIAAIPDRFDAVHKVLIDLFAENIEDAFRGPSAS
jgi:hypothetical protein